MPRTLARDIVTAILSATAVMLVFLLCAATAHAATGHTVTGQVATTSAKDDASASDAEASADVRPDPASDPRVAAILVTRGDYEPTVASDVLSADQWAAMLDVYRVSEAGAPGCDDQARTLLVTGDYTPGMWLCLGDEDSRAVSTLLALGGH